MKQFLLSLSILLVIAGCKSSKDYLSRADEDRTVFDVIKKLNKSPDDANALMALPVLYPKAIERHIKKINSYSNNSEISRWDKITDEYSTLQKMYDAIINSPTSFRLVSPNSYQSALDSCRQLAAADYYRLGVEYLAYTGRENAKKAYNYFKKANQFVDNFSDAKRKMTEAYDMAIVNVIINPVQDNSYFFNTGWGNRGYNYSNEYFQQALVRELGGSRNNRYPAKFYTDWDARRENVKPDWVVDLTLRDLNIPSPITYNYSQNRSQSVESGKDTAGRTMYTTVYATVNTSRQSFSALGQMDINIMDVMSRKNITFNSYREDYKWQNETASYTGDSRALNKNDWDLINNSRYLNAPNKEEILNELYKKIYPQIKNRIIYSVDW